MRISKYLLLSLGVLFGLGCVDFALADETAPAAGDSASQSKPAKEGRSRRLGKRLGKHLGKFRRKKNGAKTETNQAGGQGNTSPAPQQ